MKNHELLYIFAQANRDVGYDKYADKLELKAIELECEDILQGSMGQKTDDR
jgi:hypothetical protein